MDRFGNAYEIEFKFIPQKDERAVVAELAQLFEPEFGFAKMPPRAIVDIYFDTADLRLYHANATLRLRRWATPYKRKPHVTSTFKYPPVSGLGIKRHELKTLLSQDEAQQACDGGIIGESAKHAIALLSLDQTEFRGFQPQVIIETLASSYILRHRMSTDPHVLHRGKSSDLLYLTFDHCSMYAVPAEDNTERFLRNGVFDVDPSQESADIYMAELEVLAEAAHFKLANELYERAFHQMRRSGVVMPTKSKYSGAIDAIKRVGARHE